MYTYNCVYSFKSSLRKGAGMTGSLEMNSCMDIGYYDKSFFSWKYLMLFHLFLSILAMLVFSYTLFSETTWKLIFFFSSQNLETSY